MASSEILLNGEVRCRCGQIGVVTGIQGPATQPELVWVTHKVRLDMQTHIHRSAQIKNLLTQSPV